MKKFFITLFIILILGGAVFFLGWAQFRVPIGYIGIISSKTHGVDPTPVTAGEFRWIWQKLIPTNVKISNFRPETINHTINFNSALPSGASYAAFAGVAADFSWELRGVVRFNIKPDKLVTLVYEHNFTGQDDLNRFMADTAKSIENLILRTFALMDDNNERLENLLAGNRDEEMEKEIYARFEYIRDFSFTVQYARFPDFALYRHVRLLYEEFLSMQREVIAEGFAARAEQHITAHLHFQELARYGELLTTFPILLDFLKLENRRGAYSNP